MRVWVIRGGDHVDEFVRSGSVGLDYPEVGNVRRADRWDLERALESNGRSVPDVHATMLLTWVHEVLPGDAVVVPDPARGEVVVGVIDGPYDHAIHLSDDVPRHRRAVRWVGRHAPADLPAAVADVLRQRQAIKRVDVAAFADHLAEIEAGKLGRPADELTKPRAPRASASGRARSSTPRAPRAPRAPASPPAPKKAEVAMQLCPSCFQQKPAALFDGEVCRDCE